MTATDVESDVTVSGRELWVGDNYERTASMSIPEVAERLRADIADVQFDEMLPPEATFEVTASEAGPVGLITVAISGLESPDDDALEAAAMVGRRRDTMAAVFGLASHYNRMDPARPDKPRFLIGISATCGRQGERVGFIGTMMRP